MHYFIKYVQRVRSDLSNLISITRNRTLSFPTFIYKSWRQILTKDGGDKKHTWEYLLAACTSTEYLLGSCYRDLIEISVFFCTNTYIYSVNIECSDTKTNRLRKWMLVDTHLTDKEIFLLKTWSQGDNNFNKARTYVLTSVRT